MLKLFSKNKTSKEFNPSNYKYFIHPAFAGKDPSDRIFVIRTDIRPCYDSKWTVITPSFTVAITRSDCETAEMLLDEILALPSFTRNDILALDEKDKIYYD